MTQNRVLGFPTKRAPAPIIAIGSGKGGVGKTWLSISLARAFAEAGQRTLLVDCDLGLANVDVQLGLAPDLDLAAVISGRATLNEAISPVAGGVGAAGGFDLIAGRSGAGSLADLGADEANTLAAGIATLAFSYDRIILDLAAGVDGNVMRLAAEADECLVIALEEPTSITDAYAFIKLLKVRRPDGRLAIIANQAESQSDGRRCHGAIARACETFLGFRPPLAGIITRDPAVKDAIRSQTLLATRRMQSTALADINALAATLLDGHIWSHAPEAA